MPVIWDAMALIVTSLKFDILEGIHLTIDMTCTTYILHSTVQHYIL